MNPLILIVEDDDLLRNGMRALLRMQGLGVNVAATLAEAQQQIDSASPTHLILDLNLPDGLGIDLLETLPVGTPQPRVMVLSGSADSALLARARQLGADAVLRKPPNWDEVIAWARSEPDGQPAQPDSYANDVNL